MTPRVINIITNIIGILLFILEPIKSYLTTEPFNWTTFLVCTGGAVISYFTGKGGLNIKKELKERGLMFALVFISIIGFTCLSFAQTPTPTPIEPSPIQIISQTGLPINLNGDTLYRLKAKSFDAAVGVDLANYKNLVTLRAEVSAGLHGSAFTGVGVMLNIPTLVNLMGANWQAKVINPSIGIIPGYDFETKKADIGVCLSIINIQF